jgi:hypothetical protein
VKRRRPGQRHLFSLDASGKPKPAILLLSTNYDGPVPGVWNGGGTWFEVGRAFTILEDRLGVRLTAQSIEAWSTGNKALSFGVNVTSQGGIVKGVSAQAKANEQRFILMLVTVIEGDELFSAEAPKRTASPSLFTVKRYVDAQNRYRLNTIESSTWWNNAIAAMPIIPRNDLKDAQFDAAQKRSDGEMPMVSGPITLFGLINTYDLTDRITSIVGRDFDLRTNAEATDEGAMYPMVVQVDYDLDGHQQTILHLSDQRRGREG